MGFLTTESGFINQTFGAIVHTHTDIIDIYIQRYTHFLQVQLTSLFTSAAVTHLIFLDHSHSTVLNQSFNSTSHHPYFRASFASETFSMALSIVSLS